MTIKQDEWTGLYGESWKGLISDEAFAHPAKFSRALIRRIYDHVIEEGWASKGDSVVDPFGGVALGSIDAMRLGLKWYGCELEEKFVGLGNQNIALWNERFSRMPNWGTSRLVQGDSRKLAEVLSAAECCVSSPPYEGSQVGTGEGDRKGWRGYTDIGGGTYANEAQISAMSTETFWSASRLILEQLHQVIIPGGHAVFVVKSFVRDKKIVDFPGQWAQLCEAVGFRLLHEHNALLTENYGIQGGFEGDKELTVARKSFFRRLAESKGSPKIDYENVLCFERV